MSKQVRLNERRGRTLIKYVIQTIIMEMRKVTVFITRNNNG